MKRARSEQDAVSLLRATLAGRAARMSREPTAPGVDDLRAARSRHAPRWIPPLAAAAAAAAIAGVVVAIQHSGGHPTPAAAPSDSTSALPTDSSATSTNPSPTDTSGTSTSPSPTDTSLPTSGELGVCTATLPPGWQQALNTPANLGSNARPIAAFSDGQMLVANGQSTSSTSSGAELALVASDGTSHALLAAPAGNFVWASADGDTAALMLMRGGTGYDQGATVARLVAYDESTKKQMQVTLPSSGVVDGATVMDGKVFFDERASTSAASGQIVAFDMATDTTKVVWQGNFPRLWYDGPIPRTQAGGVYLGDPGMPQTVLVAPRDLPKVVAAHMTPTIREQYLATDGTTYAWLETADPGQPLDVWSPGMSAPSHFMPSAGFPSPLVGGDNGIAAFEIDSHWLLVSGQRLVDLDTGATVTLSAPPGVGYRLLDGWIVGESPQRNTRLPLVGLSHLRC